MKVTVLANDLSMNSLGRACLLASLIERNYDVEIVGPQFSEDIWYPMKDKYSYKSVPSNSRSYQFAFNINELLRKIDGDVLYASKPLVSSFGVGLISKIRTGKPLVLDIDDWESGFAYKDGLMIKTFLWGIIELAEINSFYFIRSLEKLHNKADAITVSNRFLQSKFGGTLVPHIRDTSKFDPNKFDGEKEKKELNLPSDKKIIMFSGTPRSHKGLDILLRACNSIQNQDFAVVLVGANEDDKLIQQLPENSGYPVFYEGFQQFDELPRYIAASDIICIPQRASMSSVGQLPAKIFDAMSMGKPIVSTSISDIDEVLSGCGIVVPPDDVNSLAKSLQKLLEDESLRSELGRKARGRCLTTYNMDRYANKIEVVLSRVIE